MNESNESNEYPYAAELSMNRENLSCSWRFTDSDRNTLQGQDLSQAMQIFNHIVHGIGETSSDSTPEEEDRWKVPIYASTPETTPLLNRKGLELSGIESNFFPRIRNGIPIQYLVTILFCPLDTKWVLMEYKQTSHILGLEWGDISFIVYKVAEAIENLYKVHEDLEICSSGTAYMPESKVLADFRAQQIQDWNVHGRLEFAIANQAEKPHAWWRFLEPDGTAMQPINMRRVVESLAILDSLLNKDIFFVKPVPRPIPHAQDPNSLFYANNEIVFIHEWPSLHYGRYEGIDWTHENSKKFENIHEMRVPPEHRVDFGKENCLVFWKHLTLDGKPTKAKNLPKIHADLQSTLGAMMLLNAQHRDLRICTQNDYPVINPKET